MGGAADADALAFGDAKPAEQLRLACPGEFACGRVSSGCAASSGRSATLGDQGQDVVDRDDFVLSACVPAESLLEPGTHERADSDVALVGGGAKVVEDRLR